MTQDYIGVDLSKDWLDVCDPVEGKAYRVKNTPRSVRAWLGKLRVQVYIIIEATSGCDRVIMAEAAAAGVGLARVNPGRARFFALSLGRAKTDRADARVLAEMGRAQCLRPQTLSTPARLRLVELVRRRTQLKDMETQEKQHLAAATLSALKAGIRAHLTRLARQIAEVEALIEAEIAADPELCAAHDLLRSAPGMGPVTTAVVLAHLAELGQLSRREIARLAGLAPEARESGRWQGKRRIGGGRRQVRRALYQAALVIYSHKRVDRPWIEAQLARGKAPKAVICAMARRLLCRLNAMMRTNTQYEAPA